jgi:hypothetical protein
VLLELLPLSGGGFAVFGFGAASSASAEERSVGVDEFVVEEDGTVGYWNCLNTCRRRCVWTGMPLLILTV